MRFAPVPVRLACTSSGGINGQVRELPENAHPPLSWAALTAVPFRPDRLTDGSLSHAISLPSHLAERSD
jgi:hypothetical protein